MASSSRACVRDKRRRGRVALTPTCPRRTGNAEAALFGENYPLSKCMSYLVVPFVRPPECLEPSEARGVWLISASPHAPAPSRRRRSTCTGRQRPSTWRSCGENETQGDRSTKWTLRGWNRTGSTWSCTRPERRARWMRCCAALYRSDTFSRFLFAGSSRGAATPTKAPTRADLAPHRQAWQALTRLPCTFYQFCINKGNANGPHSRASAHAAQHSRASASASAKGALALRSSLIVHLCELRTH